ncbi:MAG TPA: nuclear transport factor 2 family protein [Longimicrobiales bacterium]|nr:nuclear transport factor 2 family protein [Longimicrobiales bacterium]
MRPRFIPLLLLALAQGCAPTRPATTASPATLEQQVFTAERAFARTMADRDHAAFTRMLSDEAVFFTGPAALRGREAVAAHWKRFYEGERAPFAWEPDTVQVLESGTLALSTGPVRDPAGTIVGRFNSIWRRESPGVWRVVFDKGQPVCPPPSR